MSAELPTQAICATCGENPLLPAALVGCGKPIHTCAEVYRCTDCGVPFHRECAKRHFGQDGGR